MNKQSLETNQFSISYELLQLLEWILEHEQETFKKLIVKALRDGVYDSTSFHKSRVNGSEPLQQTVLDFFHLLEQLLYETMSQHEVENLIQKSQMPFLDHLDSTQYTPATMQQSVAKAITTNKNTGKDIQDIFFKELLKRWKPDKKISSH
ncbi:MAG TPA: hypothetical protein VHA52_10145 [Candidatus Babeliaceae bacterium]|nr:hypothetical protein [Candidatus Babeliaceae bacterium]